MAPEGLAGSWAGTGRNGPGPVSGEERGAERPVISDLRAQGAERRPELGREELRLLPGREVAALVDLVEVNQIAIGAPGPCLRGSLALPRKHRDGHRERDLVGLLRRREGR